MPVRAAFMAVLRRRSSEVTACAARTINPLVLQALIMAAAWTSGGRAQSPPAPELEKTLSALGARVQQYYERISTIICEETVTQQPLKTNLTPAGKARVTVYELSVRPDAAAAGGEFRVERTLQLETAGVREAANNRAAPIPKPERRSRSPSYWRKISAAITFRGIPARRTGRRAQTRWTLSSRRRAA
jgi:hypothetical protein